MVRTNGSSLMGALTLGLVVAQAQLSPLTLWSALTFCVTLRARTHFHYQFMTFCAEENKRGSTVMQQNGIHD